MFYLPKFFESFLPNVSRCRLKRARSGSVTAVVLLLVVGPTYYRLSSGRPDLYGHGREVPLVVLAAPVARGYGRHGCHGGHVVVSDEGASVAPLGLAEVSGPREETPAPPSAAADVAVGVVPSPVLSLRLGRSGMSLLISLSLLLSNYREKKNLLFEK